MAEQTETLVLLVQFDLTFLQTEHMAHVSLYNVDWSEGDLVRPTLLYLQK